MAYRTVRLDRAYPEPLWLIVAWNAWEVPSPAKQGRFMSESIRQHKSNLGFGGSRNLRTCKRPTAQVITLIKDKNPLTPNHYERVNLQHALSVYEDMLMEAQA